MGNVPPDFFTPLFTFWLDFEGRMGRGADFSLPLVSCVKNLGVLGWLGFGGWPWGFYLLLLFWRGGSEKPGFLGFWAVFWGRPPRGSF